MGIGGVQSDSAAIQAYFDRHTEVVGNPPDSWASAVTYTSLQMLQEAIKRVGLDREAVAAELATGSFETIMGTVELENNQLRTLWWGGAVAGRYLCRNCTCRRYWGGPARNPQARLAITYPQSMCHGPSMGLTRRCCCHRFVWCGHQQNKVEKQCSSQP